MVAAVRKRGSTKFRADLDHFVPERDDRGRGIWSETHDRNGIREHFGERETRFVPVYNIRLSLDVWLTYESTPDLTPNVSVAQYL